MVNYYYLCISQMGYIYYWLFWVSCKEVFIAETLVVRKNSKTIKISNLASTKSNTCNCRFSRNGIFSHDR